MKQLILILLMVCSISPASAFLGGLFGGDESAVPAQQASAIEPPLVQAFDIAGITLGATYPYIKKEWLPNTEYKLMDTDKKIPDYFRYNYNYECRHAGNEKPTAIERCIKMLAGKNKTEYIEKMVFKRLSTGEYLEIYFTSHETDNLVYKIKYNNDANKIEGIGAAYLYQKQEKIRNFWAKTLEKYGKPNLGQQIWASDPGDEKEPLMRAYYGQLVLENLRLYEKDVAESQMAAQTQFKAKKYDF